MFKANCVFSMGMVLLLLHCAVATEDEATYDASGSSSLPSSNSTVSANPAQPLAELPAVEEGPLLLIHSDGSTVSEGGGLREEAAFSSILTFLAGTGQHPLNPIQTRASPAVTRDKNHTSQWPSDVSTPGSEMSFSSSSASVETNRNPSTSPGLADQLTMASSFYSPSPVSFIGENWKHSSSSSSLPSFSSLLPPTTPPLLLLKSLLSSSSAASSSSSSFSVAKASSSEWITTAASFKDHDWTLSNPLPQTQTAALAPAGPHDWTAGSTSAQSTISSAADSPSVSSGPARVSASLSNTTYTERVSSENHTEAKRSNKKTTPSFYSPLNNSRGVSEAHMGTVKHNAGASTKMMKTPAQSADSSFSTLNHGQFPLTFSDRPTQTQRGMNSISTSNGDTHASVPTTYDQEVRTDRSQQVILQTPTSAQLSNRPKGYLVSGSNVTRGSVMGTLHEVEQDKTVAGSSSETAAQSLAHLHAVMPSISPATALKTPVTHFTASLLSPGTMQYISPLPKNAVAKLTSIPLGMASVQHASYLGDLEKEAGHASPKVSVLNMNNSQGGMAEAELYSASAQMHHNSSYSLMQIRAEWTSGSNLHFPSGTVTSSTLSESLHSSSTNTNTPEFSSKAGFPREISQGSSGTLKWMLTTDRSMSLSSLLSVKQAKVMTSHAVHKILPNPSQAIDSSPSHSSQRTYHNNANDASVQPAAREAATFDEPKSLVLEQMTTSQIPYGTRTTGASHGAELTATALTEKAAHITKTEETVHGFHMHSTRQLGSSPAEHAVSLDSDDNMTQLNRPADIFQKNTVKRSDFPSPALHESSAATTDITLHKTDIPSLQHTSLLPSFNITKHFMILKRSSEGSVKGFPVSTPFTHRHFLLEHLKRLSREDATATRHYEQFSISAWSEIIQPLRTIHHSPSQGPFNHVSRNKSNFDIQTAVPFTSSSAASPTSENSQTSIGMDSSTFSYHTERTLYEKGKTDETVFFKSLSSESGNPSIASDTSSFQTSADILTPERTALNERTSSFYSLNSAEATAITSNLYSVQPNGTELFVTHPKNTPGRRPWSLSLSPADLISPVAFSGAQRATENTPSAWPISGLHISPALSYSVTSSLAPSIASVSNGNYDPLQTMIDVGFPKAASVTDITLPINPSHHLSVTANIRNTADTPTQADLVPLGYLSLSSPLSSSSSSSPSALNPITDAELPHSYSNTTVSTFSQAGMPFLSPSSSSSSSTEVPALSPSVTTASLLSSLYTNQTAAVSSAKIPSPSLALSLIAVAAQKSFPNMNHTTSPSLSSTSPSSSSSSETPASSLSDPKDLQPSSLPMIHITSSSPSPSAPSSSNLISITGVMSSSSPTLVHGTASSSSSSSASASPSSSASSSVTGTDMEQLTTGASTEMELASPRANETSQSPSQISLPVKPTEKTSQVSPLVPQRDITTTSSLHRVNATAASNTKTAPRTPTPSARVTGAATAQPAATTTPQPTRKITTILVTTRPAATRRPFTPPIPRTSSPRGASTILFSPFTTTTTDAPPQQCNITERMWVKTVVSIYVRRNRLDSIQRQNLRRGLSQSLRKALNDSMAQAQVETVFGSPNMTVAYHVTGGDMVYPPSVLIEALASYGRDRLIADLRQYLPMVTALPLTAALWRPSPATGFQLKTVLRFVGAGDDPRSCRFSQMIEQRLENVFSEAQSKVLNTHSRLSVQMLSVSQVVGSPAVSLVYTVRNGTVYLNGTTASNLLGQLTAELVGYFLFYPPLIIAEPLEYHNLNTSIATRDFWVITVIQDVDNSSLEGHYQSFASLMEQRLAELFVVAGQQGTRFRRATTVGSYTVQMVSIRRVAGLKNPAEMTYYVQQNGVPLPGTSTAKVLNTVDSQTMALTLGYFVQLQAEPVVKNPPNNLWIIAAVLCPIAVVTLIIIIITAVLCRKNKNDFKADAIGNLNPRAKMAYRRDVGYYHQPVQGFDYAKQHLGRQGGDAETLPVTQDTLVLPLPIRDASHSLEKTLQMDGTANKKNLTADLRKSRLPSEDGSVISNESEKLNSGRGLTVQKVTAQQKLTKEEPRKRNDPYDTSSGSLQLISIKPMAAQPTYSRPASSDRSQDSAILNGEASMALKQKSDIEHYRNKLRLKAKRKGYYDFPSADGSGSSRALAQRQRHSHERAPDEHGRPLEPDDDRGSTYVKSRRRHSQVGQPAYRSRQSLNSPSPGGTEMDLLVMRERPRRGIRNSGYDTEPELIEETNVDRLMGPRGYMYGRGVKGHSETSTLSSQPSIDEVRQQMHLLLEEAFSLASGGHSTSGRHSHHNPHHGHYSPGPPPLPYTDAVTSAPGTMNRGSRLGLQWVPSYGADMYQYSLPKPAFRFTQLPDMAMGSPPPPLPPRTGPPPGTSLRRSSSDMGPKGRSTETSVTDLQSQHDGNPYAPTSRAALPSITAEQPVSNYSGNPITAVYAIPATRPGYSDYFVSTPPTSYRSPSWMSYPPEPEDVPPQWADSVPLPGYVEAFPHPRYPQGSTPQLPLQYNLPPDPLPANPTTTSQQNLPQAGKDMVSVPLSSLSTSALVQAIRQEVAKLAKKQNDMFEFQV